MLQDVTLGFAFGIAMGLLAAALMPRTQEIPEHQQSLYALGAAFATYGVTVALPPEGNGLIAVFVCAITLGIRRHDLRETFEDRADDIVEIVKLGVFVVFGSLLTLDGLFGDGWAAVAIVAITLLVARPVAIAVALLGTKLPFYLQAFMAWFGPKGVATMTFSLLVLGRGLPRRRADLQPRRAVRVRLDPRPRADRHARGPNWVARRAERPAPAR